MLVGVGLGLMFPFKVLVDRVLRDQRGDALTLSYLHNLLRTDPHNAELILRLARQQFAAENFGAMRDTLRPLLATGAEDDRIEARLLLWRASEREWRKTRPGSAAYLAQQNALLQELRELAALRLDERTQIEIAQRAIELGDRELALHLFHVLANRPSGFDAEWFARYAHQLQGEGQYETAQALFLLARDKATSLRMQREYFEAAVRVLISRNRPADALALAEQEIKSLDGDLDSLVFMVELARSANRPQEAARYARQMLRLSLLEHWRALAANYFEIRTVADEKDEKDGQGPQPHLPFDDRVYTLGYDAFLGNRNLDEAYRVAESAVRQAPDNAAWRLRLAHVAEWSGRPQIAVEHWRWLAEHDAAGNRQGQDGNHAGLAAPGAGPVRRRLRCRLGLLRSLRADPGNMRLLKALIDAYERLGEPEEGIAMLKRFRRRPAAAGRNAGAGPTSPHAPPTSISPSTPYDK